MCPNVQCASKVTNVASVVLQVSMGGYDCQHCYQLLGVDVILDSKLHPYVIEVSMREREGGGGGGRVRAGGRGS